MKIFGYDVIKSVGREAAVDIEKAKAAKPKNTAMGLIGLRTSSGLVEEEFINTLRWPQAGKIYQEMASNDAVVGGCLYLIETIARKATWDVRKGGDDEESAEFIKTCMRDMEHTWDDFVCEVLSMLTYGFSFHEVLYKVRRGPIEKDPKFRSKFTDGKLGWRELSVRSQATLDTWVFDDATGKALEFIQTTDTKSGMHIPLEGNLLFRTKSTRHNPEGWSILRRAYRSWYFKRYMEELEGIGVERSLAGIPVLQPPEDLPLFDPNNKEMVEMLGWAQTLVDGLRQDRNHGLVLPGGWALKLLGPESKGNLNTDTIIRRHETRIAMCMLSDLVLMGGDRTGSFALAETKQDLFVSSLKAILNGICEVLNSAAIPQLLAMNGIQPEAYPEIYVKDLQTPSIKELALLLRSMNIDVTKNKELYNFLMTTAGAPTVDDEALLAEMGLEGGKGSPTDPGEPQDTLTNEFKQSDLDYQ